jgi:hypothetical protein
MARYPGTQFVLRDHSDASAAVPIQQVSNSAPVYMTTFRAPKGPEDMLLVDGQRFYNLYGSQDKIKFNTYKQPLLQASMDINEGARLISKRAVLDSAMLGNATVGVVLSKQVDVTFTKNEDGYIDAATFGTTAKYVLRPVVVSIKDNANTPGDSSFVESKFMYKTHKDTISSEIEMKETLAMNTGLVGVYTSGTSTENIPLDNGTWTGDVYAAGSILNGNSNEVEFTAPGGSAEDPDYTSADTDEKKAKVQAKFLSTVYAAANGGEYFFPLFSIFDNGRGASLKNYAIVFDINTSKSIGKAVYTLKVADSVTGRTLETYAFTVNPYSRNTNTGYTFDIESAVNLKSDQIKVKYYYDAYDKLMQIINDELSITNEYLFDDADCLFDHDLSGNTLVDNRIARGATADLYSLANSSANNLDSGDNNITYYYYNYKTRSKQNIFENLRYGSDGVIDNNVYTTTVTVKANVGDVPPVYDTATSPQAITTLAAGTTANVGFMVAGETAETHTKCTAAINLLKLIPELGINFSGADFETGDDHSSATKLKVATTGGGYIYVSAVVTKVQNGVETGTYKYDVTVTVQEYSWDLSYQNQYRKFFDGQFDRDIFNLDVWFPNCVFDANYDKKVKLAIQKLAAYRGDFFVYLDLNTDVKAYEDVERLINVVDDDNEFPPDEEATNFYIHDRNCAVTSIYGDIRDPYSNKQITVTATYALSRLMVKHFINGVGRPFAGQGYGIIFTDFIEGTVNYIPKIYPSSAMTSRSYIGDTYPSDDETIVNEKQQMTDLKVNYGSYYNGIFTMDTEFTLNPKDSDFSYINNIMLVHQVMQAIRKACPASRYKFIDNNDLSTYQRSVEEVLKVFRSKFAALRFKYVQDENSVANKIYYAAIEVVFRPFAQAEIFTITALNYSTLSSDVTTV